MTPFCRLLFLFAILAAPLANALAQQSPPLVVTPGIGANRLLSNVPEPTGRNNLGLGAAATPIFAGLLISGSSNLGALSGGFFTNAPGGSPAANVARVADRLLVGGARDTTSLVGDRTWVGLSAAGLLTYFDVNSQFAAYSTIGGIGGAFACRTSDQAALFAITGANACLPIATYSIADATGTGSAWGGYFSTVLGASGGGTALGLEIEVSNLKGLMAANPYSMGGAGTTAGLWLGAGGETVQGGATNYALSCAICVTAQAGAGSKFTKGMIFAAGSLASASGMAIQLPQGYQIAWTYDGNDTIGGAIKSTNTGAHQTQINFTNNGMEVQKASDGTLLDYFDYFSDLYLGSANAVGSGNPNFIDLGGEYSTIAGANPKFRIYNDGTSIYGLGVSAASLDYIAPASDVHQWWVGGVSEGKLGLGLQLGAPTGGPKGPGTANAKQLYTSGVAVKHSVLDFCAKCDVQYVLGNYTISAGGTTVALSSGTFVDVGIAKTVVLPGHAAGGQPLITTLTPTDTTHATLGAASVPGTISQFTQSLLPIAGGSGYVPGNTVTMAGGTLAPTGGTATIGTVKTTYVRAVTINAAGSGGTNGTYIVYGTTGNGNRAVFNLTVAGGAATAVAVTGAGTDGGHYSTNPTSGSAEPVATSVPGITLPTGLTLSLTMDIDTILPTTPGLYANGGLPGTFTQASTSGSGTGATFTTLLAYNSGGFVYGTDDSSAFNEAVNPSTWTIAHGGPQIGAIVETPSTPCGIASTVTRADQGVELRGTSNIDIASTYGVAIKGSALQWLGASGGTMFIDWSGTTRHSFNNKIANIAFECGVPNGGNQLWSIPLAAVGIKYLDQWQSDYGYLSFDECSSYDIYAGGSTASSTNNNQNGHIHDTNHIHALYADGIGIYLTGDIGGADTNQQIVERIHGSYQSAPLIRVVTLDNNHIGPVWFFQRGSQNVKGIDISAKVYGNSTETDQNNTLFMSGISSTSIMRGKESSVDPSTNVLVYGYDVGNSVPVTVLGPGAGNFSYQNYDGSMATSGVIVRRGYTVATLPALPGKGALAYVTDAVACTFLATVTGGGSAYCPVGYNGAAWVGE